jgi:hypothetical protein
MGNGSTSEMFQVAINYIEMGWALIPVEGLKDLDGDHCLCGKYPCGLGNKNAGKHPASGKMGWQSGPAMTVQEAYHTWEEDCPDYNMGARTGDPSGFFAVDVEAEGLPELAELEALHGKLPRTRVHRTGSGGKHYLFKMPDFEVRNSQKKLSSCIDIRGTGGMIVLPPSVSGKGMYAVEDDSPIADAPEWLLEWLRNRLRSEGPDLGDMPTVEDLPAYSDLSTDRQQQCQKYALSVIEREAARYRDAPPGTGNAELFNAACNILEIVQSPWNLYTYDHANEYLERARSERMALNPGRGQDRDEFIKTLMSARSTTIGKGRPLPPDRTESLMFDVPFTQAGSGSAGSAAGGGDPFMNPDGSFDENTPPPGGPIDPVEALLGKMLDRDDLDALPKPKPLISGLLDKNTEVWLVAPPGGFKSFIGLDWAIHVGMEIPWQGQKVSGGLVVYLVAEGSNGIGMRVEAWEKVNGKRSSGVKYLPQPVQASNAKEWDVLVEACRRLDPVMIVLDTQARITVGMEENSFKEMSVFVDAVGKLRDATGACVVVIHHTNADGSKARGSTALIGAMDTQILVERPTNREERLNLTARIFPGKQKDMAEDNSFEIQMEKVDLGIDPETQRPLSSLAIRPYDPFWEPPAKPEPEHVAKLVPNQAYILEALREHANNENGATAAELRVFILERHGYKMARGSCGTALDALMKNNLVTRIGQRYVLSENVEI